MTVFFSYVYTMAYELAATASYNNPCFILSVRTLLVVFNLATKGSLSKRKLSQIMKISNLIKSCNSYVKSIIQVCV